MVSDYDMKLYSGYGTINATNDGINNSKFTTNTYIKSIIYDGTWTSDNTYTDTSWNKLHKIIWNTANYTSLSGTTTTTDGWIHYDDGYTETLRRDYPYYQAAVERAKTPQERLKEILQRRQSPMIFVSRKPIVAAVDSREERARETLRLCLGEDRFRSFIKNGFVSVRAKSGLVYQIFPGHGMTTVYKHGQQIERLCVVFRGDFPPADSLIMRFLLILNDEEEFRNHAVKHMASRPRTAIPSTELESLPDIYRRLKRVA